nr:enoyl-CoA hydratase-related protein [Angustibacter aerolatus]
MSDADATAALLVATTGRRVERRVTHGALTLVLLGDLHVVGGPAHDTACLAGADLVLQAAERRRARPGRARCAGRRGTADLPVRGAAVRAARPGDRPRRSAGRARGLDPPRPGRAVDLAVGGRTAAGRLGLTPPTIDRLLDRRAWPPAARGRGTLPRVTQQPVRVEQVGGVGVLVLDDPDRRNVLSAAAVDAVADAVQRLEDDGGVRALVVTGAGSAFCAGAEPEHARALRRG